MSRLNHPTLSSGRRGVASAAGAARSSDLISFAALLFSFGFAAALTLGFLN